MSNQVFHFSNTGISSGQRFYLKDDISGIFVRNLNIDSNFPVVASNLVYNTGDQSIYGNKTFLNNVSVSGSGIFNALDLNNIDILSLSGVDVSITNGNVSLTNRPTVNGTGVVLSGELNPIIVNTGSILDNKINSLSGYVNSQDIVFSGQTFNTGSRLDNKINSLSGYVNSQTTSGQIFNTGSVLDSKINSLSGYVNSQDIIISGQTFSTGSRLDSKINSLSGYVDSKSITLPSTIVYTTGDQIISGNKTFINNIAVSGTGNFNSVKVSSIDKLFLSGIDIVVTGNSSINVYNSIYISGNPVLTGIIPTTQTISNVVYTTGDQTISGNKNFVENVTFGDQTQDDLLVISGNEISFGVYPTVNGTGIVYTQGNQTISGNKTFTSPIYFISGSYIDLRANGGNGGNIVMTGNAGEGDLYPSNAGSINLSAGIGGNGGSINLQGSQDADETNKSSGGSIDLSAGAADGSPGGSIISIGGAGGTRPGGTLNMSDGGGNITTSNGGSINTSNGGSINTSEGGGSISTSGNSDGTGGSINTEGNDGGTGGSINTSGNQDLSGGSINTSAVPGEGGGAGGSINTSNAGGSINTSNHGGSIDTSGVYDEEGTGNGGSIDLRGLSAYGGVGGSIISTGGTEGNSEPGGSLNMSAGINGGGGSINTSSGGGSINLSEYGGSINLSGNEYGYSGGNITAVGGDGHPGGSLNMSSTGDADGGSINTSADVEDGGSINTSGGANAAGGSINTSAGVDGPGGSINTSNAGGSIDTSGGGYINTSENGGFINTSDSGGYISTLQGGYISTENGGYIDTSSGGGYILTSAKDADSGGSIDTSGGVDGGNMPGNGGEINTSGGDGDGGGPGGNGGSINTSGGNSGGSSGGSIDTSNGGGSINTREKGFIEFGNFETRTILSGSATIETSVIRLTLPNANGKLALDSTIANTGSILDNKINSLSGVSVLTFGNQNIFGTKSFISNTFFDKDIIVTGNIRATGTSYFNDNLNVVNTLNVSGNLNIGGSLSAPNVVLTRGRQTISGVKTLANELNLNAYTGNGYDNTNNEFRLNIGGDRNENVGIQIDAYGTNPPQILMRRARGIPTGLSGVLKDDVLFNLQARGYVSGLNNYSTNSRAAIRLIAAEDWVGRDGYTGQGTYILFRSTNIGSGLAMDKVIIGTSGINVLNGNIYISGNPVLTGIDLSSYATVSNLFATGSILDNKISSLSGFFNNNVVYITGSQNIYGNKTFFDSGIFSNGAVPAVPLLNNPLSIVGSGNNYLQVNIQNRATGSFATADLVITANNGTDNTNYINLGINNSGYNDPNFSNGSGLDGYLFVNGGNLDIGTQTPNTAVEFHVGGSTASRAIARIDSSGINVVSGTYKINNVPYNTFLINFLSSNANLSAGANYISNVGAGYSPTFTDRSIPMFEPCAARKASISLLNSGPGTNLVGVTGYFINTSTNPPQTGIINSAITALVGSNQYTYTGAFVTPINISHGDNVVCAIFSTGTTTNVRTAASIYCYN